MIFAVMSFYTFSWPWSKCASPVLTKDEDDAVELLRRKESSSSIVVSFVDAISRKGTFNARALARARVLGKYDAEKARVLRLCATFSHKIASLEKVESLIEVAETAWNCFQKNEPVPARIRREDLRQIESFAKSSDILELLSNVSGSKPLDQFRAAVHRCKVWQESVLAALMKETRIVLFGVSFLFFFF